MISCSLAAFTPKTVCLQDDPEVVFMLPLTGIVDPEDEAGAADGSTIPDQASDTQSQETAKAEA